MDMTAERVVAARENGWQDVNADGWKVDRTLGFAHLGGATLDNEENISSAGARRQSRDTLAAIFVSQAVLGAALLAVAGTFEQPGPIPALLVAAVAGHVPGRCVVARLHPESYERVTLALLAATALAALAAGLR